MKGSTESNRSAKSASTSLPSDSPVEQASIIPKDSKVVFVDAQSYRQVKKNNTEREEPPVPTLGEVLLEWIQKIFLLVVTKLGQITEWLLAILRRFLSLTLAKLTWSPWAQKQDSKLLNNSDRSNDESPSAENSPPQRRPASWNFKPSSMPSSVTRHNNKQNTKGK